MTTHTLHTPCPSQDDVLLAVCDVLVTKALETMGKWIVREQRSRYNALGSRPTHIAHTIWQPTDAIVDKATRGAWDVVPAMLNTHGGCCTNLRAQDVTHMLDDYVHDLAITGTMHSLAELVYRFDHRLVRLDRPATQVLVSVPT